MKSINTKPQSEKRYQRYVFSRMDKGFILRTKYFCQEIRKMKKSLISKNAQELNRRFTKDVSQVALNHAQRIPTRYDRLDPPQQRRTISKKEKDQEKDQVWARLGRGLNIHACLWGCDVARPPPERAIGLCLLTPSTCLQGSEAPLPSAQSKPQEETKEHSREHVL